VGYLAFALNILRGYATIPRPENATVTGCCCPNWSACSAWKTRAVCDKTITRPCTMLALANDPRVSPMWRKVARTTEGEVYQHVVSGEIVYAARVGHALPDGAAPEPLSARVMSICTSRHNQGKRQTA
jgi:hypothetical protein